MGRLGFLQLQSKLQITQETAPTDFLQSCGTRQIEQPLRNSRNVSTRLNKGTRHQPHPADPASKRVARGNKVAEQTEHN